MLKAYKSKKKPIIFTVITIMILVIVTVFIGIKINENKLKLPYKTTKLSDINASEIISEIKTNANIEDNDLFTSPVDFKPITISKDFSISNIEIKFTSIKNSSMKNNTLLLSSDIDKSKIKRDIFGKFANQSYFLTNNYLQRIHLESILNCLKNFPIESIVNAYFDTNSNSHTLVFSRSISSSHDKSTYINSNSDNPIIFINKENIQKEITSINEIDSIGNFALFSITDNKTIKDILFEIA